MILVKDVVLRNGSKYKKGTNLRELVDSNKVSKGVIKVLINHNLINNDKSSNKSTVETKGATKRTQDDTKPFGIKGGSKK